MKTFVTIALLLLALTGNTEEMVFHGLPSERFKVSDVIEKEVMTDSQASEFQVMIVRDGEDFYWASREYKPMLQIHSGIYTIYLSSAGYVKVEEPTGDYIEHMTIGLNTITYKGGRAKRAE
jgi:hypothetical protein